MLNEDVPIETARYETLQLQNAGDHVLHVTLHRPARGNALDTQMGRELLDLWTRLTEDPAPLRCVVLSGAGDRIFCAGGDLKERYGMDSGQWQRQHALFERMFWTLVDLPLPVIAAVNGHAVGGGLELALCCDFIFASQQARFALTEVTLGIMPGGGGTQNLPRAVGERRAKQIVLTGESFDAAQALQWGLVNEVHAADRVVGRALEAAARIALNAPKSVRQAKKAMRFGGQMELRTAYRFEVEAYNALVDTQDRIEGVRAFNEKRAPVFQDR
jgi:enoyl-CoA hydratase/carnithine racemase